MAVSATDPPANTTPAAFKTWAQAVKNDLDALDSGTSDADLLSERDAASASNAGHFYFATDVDGGTLYRSSGSSWAQVAPGVAEELGPQPTIYKAVDEVVNNSAAFQFDDDLTFAVATGEVWRLTYHLFVDGSTTGKVKFRLNPTSGNVYGGLLGPHLTATGVQGDARYVGDVDGGGLTIACGLAGVGSSVYVIISAIVVTGSTGTLALEWAQNAADATNLTVKAYSHLVRERIA